MEQISRLPKILWVAIVSLAVFGIFHFITGLSQPIQLFAFALNIVLIFGLLRLAKWAFILSIIASITGPVLLLFSMANYFFLVLLINCTVLIPLLLCTRAFFPKNVSQHAPA